MAVDAKPTQCRMSRPDAFIFFIIIILLIPGYSCGAGFTGQEIEFETRSLVNKMEISRDISYKLKNRLSAALKDPVINEAVNSWGVDAVFVFSSGEGGVLIKYRAGEGLVSFFDGRKACPIYIKSWSIGALIGGAAQWGVGLVVGRADEGDFGGYYKGALRSATALEAATTGIQYYSRPRGGGRHEIYLITTGRGLSAGVGGELINIIPGW